VYHYAGNNPVKYVDPDGREDEDTTSVRVIFYYNNPVRDKDRSFKKAAETLSQSYNEKTYMIGVMTETEFKQEWESVNSMLGTNGERISSFDILSHGDTKNLYFVGDPLNDGSLAVDEVANLTKLNFSMQGEINLNSCQSGTLKENGIGQVFADTQGVKVSGQYRASSFSTNPRFYSAITPESSSIYLQAYDKGRNNPWGRGGAYPRRIYMPK
jgi:hypothetical protein